MHVSKNNLLVMSIITLFGFSGLAYVILSFSEVSYFDMFKYQNLLTSIPIGLVFGAVAALLGILMLKLPILKDTEAFYAQVFKDVELDIGDIFFYSFCAGVGEEILFRGTLQPLMGLWWAAILFVILHGYISFKDWKKSMYGLFLIFVSAGFGYLTQYFDIFSAMAAHFMYDVIMFLRLKNKSSQISAE